MSKIKLSTIKKNPKNPRVIKDSKYRQLKKSIEEFPKMMKLSPLVIDKSGVIWRGTQRLAILKDLGYTEIPGEWVKRAEDFTKAELREFMIKDNTHAGDWDFEELATWDAKELRDWGVDMQKRREEAVEYVQRHEIVVECKDEEDQQKIYNEFTEKGYTCRVLTL